MSQFDVPQKSPEQTREEKKQEYIAPAQELSNIREGFPFPGVRRASYFSLKATAEQYPEYSAQTDELIGRFRAQGMKIVLSKDPKSGNVFVLPLNSQDVEMDNFFPRHLEIAEGMDERLKKLILLNTELLNTQLHAPTPNSH